MWFKELIEALFGLALFLNAALFIPQIIKLVRSKDAAQLSLTTFVAFNLVQGIQILYALLKQDYYYFWGMAAALLFCGIVTILIQYNKIKHENFEPNRSKRKSGLFLVGVSLFILALAIGIIITLLYPQNKIFIALVDVLYVTGFIWVIIGAIPQIILLIKNKKSNELSLITFLGLNFIQIISAIHAYLHKETLFLFSMISLFVVYGFVTYLILFYRYNEGKTAYRISN